MEIKKININELKPYKKNPRKNDNAVQYVAESIKQFGFKVPIIIDKNNEIIAGHTRYKAAKELNISQVPCIVADDLSEEQIKAFRLADNKVAEKSEWDFDLLEDELNDILNIDMSLFDFDFDIEDINIEVEEDDFEPTIHEEAKTKLGDIYQLGKHRLLCGNSENVESIKKLMNNTKADTVFTDPPYDFTECNYNESIEKNIENANVFIMNDDENMVRYLRKSNLNFKGFFIANFGFASPRGNNPYLQHILVSHETIGNANSNKNMKDGFRSIIKMDYRGRLRDEKTEHKHQKSIKFIADFLKHYDSKIVLDLFGGSGSTLIACEQLGIQCYMSELNPLYVDLIIERWEKHTSKKAIKIK